MVEISLSGSGEGLGRVIARGYSTASTQQPTPRHHSLDEGADAKADRISRGPNQFSPENGLGDVDAVRCFMA